MPTFKNRVELLKQTENEPILLTGEKAGALVVVSPKLVGRVMDATFKGEDGETLAWWDEDLIQGKKGQNPAFYNNVGGDSRIWWAPEAGGYTTFFDPGKPYEEAQWRVPDIMGKTQFQNIKIKKEGKRQVGVTYDANVQATMYNGNPLNLYVKRAVKMVEQPFSKTNLKKFFADQSIQYVGYSTTDSIKNTGAKPLNRKNGLVSMWVLGQYQPGLETYVILPILSGSNEKLGPPVVDYNFFNNAPVPANRKLIRPNYIVYKTDGQYRGKLGLKPGRAKSTVGSIDLKNNLLTIVDAKINKKGRYLNSLWTQKPGEELLGSASETFNDGPMVPGGTSLGGFYELERLSDAPDLKRGEGYSFTVTTRRYSGDLEQLLEIAKHPLGLDCDLSHESFK